jgi:hypothetical protein
LWILVYWLLVGLLLLSVTSYLVLLVTGY